MSNKRENVLPFRFKITPPVTALWVCQHYMGRRANLFSFDVEQAREIELLKEVDATIATYEIKGFGMQPVVFTLQNGSQSLKEFYVLEANIKDFFAALEAIKKQILNNG